MNICGKRVVLRAIEEKDLADLQGWANDPDIQSLLTGWHFPIGARDQRQWFERQSLNSSDQRFAIETEKGELVGTANLVGIDWLNRTATHGVMIGRADVRGKGVAQDAVMAIARHAFDVMDLHRLDAEVIALNERSIRFYTEKCGWTEEGRRTAWFYRHGQRWDKVLLGLTKEQYRAFAATTGYWS